MSITFPMRSYNIVRESRGEQLSGMQTFDSSESCILKGGM